MGQSPLKIESYYLRTLEYRLKEQFESGSLVGTAATIDPKIQVSVQTGRGEDDNKDWRVEIDVKGGEESEFPYTFEISFVGFFRVSDGFPNDKQELLVSVNGPSILFAAAREFISIVTARSPYPPILLPSISFVPEKQPAVEEKGKKKVPLKSSSVRPSKIKPLPKTKK